MLLQINKMILLLVYLYIPHNLCHYYMIQRSTLLHIIQE